MKRELFSTRLGFLLITAGCAIGLGNVWRFPYITGQYGGAIFVLVYIICLLCIGLPILCCELAVGRASRRSLGGSFEVLTPNSRWRQHKYWMCAGNYILMSFYSLVTGWMLYYTLKTLSGGFALHIDEQQAGQYFGQLLSEPLTQSYCTLVVVLLGFTVCALGLKKGVERYTKPLMIVLLALLIFLAIRSVFLPGFSEGMAYYLKPNFDNIEASGLLTTLTAAMGQAFFTLGLGVGSIQIFGSYMSKKRSLVSEALNITILDTIVALLAGVVIFPACFSYAIAPGAGPGLIFVTLVSVFSNMEYGNLWGGIFFLFLLFAAISTLIAVFENLIGICMDLFKISRLKAVAINFAAVMLLGLPCLLGYNLWSDIHPLGGESTILDSYDFVLSLNILPLGALVYVIYVSYQHGWGFDKFKQEVDEGQGLKLNPKLILYFKIILPLLIMLLFIQGYVALLM